MLLLRLGREVWVVIEGEDGRVVWPLERGHLLGLRRCVPRVVRVRGRGSGYVLRLLWYLAECRRLKSCRRAREWVICMWLGRRSVYRERLLLALVGEERVVPGACHRLW